MFSDRRYSVDRSFDIVIVSDSATLSIEIFQKKSEVQPTTPYTRKMGLKLLRTGVVYVAHQGICLGRNDRVWN